MESSTTVLNGGLDANKASAAPCLGQGCQEAAPAWRQLPSAQWGQHGTGGAWSEGLVPGAASSHGPKLSLFLCLALFKAEVLLAKSFGGGGERVESQREPSC